MKKEVINCDICNVEMEANAILKKDSMVKIIAEKGTLYLWVGKPETVNVDICSESCLNTFLRGFQQATVRHKSL